uniref:Uncharacterized protein n=1 Tax=Timema shepardi TaxID=629360 RepID=A0A7R9G2T7_TIMSH|nr:unnamed protein product [Timema shepardi]
MNGKDCLPCHTFYSRLSVMEIKAGRPLEARCGKRCHQRCLGTYHVLPQVSRKAKEQGTVIFVSEHSVRLWEVLGSSLCGEFSSRSPQGGRKGLGVRSYGTLNSLTYSTLHWRIVHKKHLKLGTCKPCKNIIQEIWTSKRHLPHSLLTHSDSTVKLVRAAEVNIVSHPKTSCRRR